jgi:starvation-inducible DNA-binding protein
MAKKQPSNPITFAAPDPAAEAAADANEPMDLLTNLATVVADTFTLYITAHGFHWNVRGDEFSQYHKFFGKIYEDVWGSVDTWGENIRKIGGDVQFRLTDFIATRELDDSPFVVGTIAEMVTQLLAANQMVIDCLNEAFAVATAENQQGIANFAAERIDQHQKWAWQLSASLADDGDETAPAA